MEIDWEKLIEEGISAIPEKYRLTFSNVALLVEDEPSRAIRAQEGLSDDETLLGLYQGIPLTERGEGYGVGETMPDTITLYRLPILEEAGNDLHEIARVVRDTIWHEFGHHLGLAEDEVRKKEVDRGIR